MDPDTGSVVVCPQCGLVLQTLDLPCPACGPAALEPVEGQWTLHEFSKTFRTRHLFRPKTDRFVDQLNAWMAEQPGLLLVMPIVHRDGHGIVRGATLTCHAGSIPALDTFRFFRIRLLLGRSGWRHRDLGEALNEWADSHPDYERVWHCVMSSTGVPSECWILAKGPPSVSSAREQKHRGEMRLAVLGRRVGMLAVAIAILTGTGALVLVAHAPQPVGSLALIAAIFGAGQVGRRMNRKRMEATRAASKAFSEGP